MSKSLLEELRFKIGEQYELNEFNLKSLESTFSNGLEYENYEYIKGDFNMLFGLKLTSNAKLQYNGDILCSILYQIDLTDLEKLIEQLNVYLPLSKKMDKRNAVLGKTFPVISFHEYNLKLDIAEDITVRVYKDLG